MFANLCVGYIGIGFVFNGLFYDVPFIAFVHVWQGLSLCVADTSYGLVHTDNSMCIGLILISKAFGCDVCID